MAKKETKKRDYSKIEAKDNMKVGEEESGENLPTEREKITPVLEKKPEKRKKGLMERLVVGFLGPDGLPGIGAYLNEEIILPSIKNIIVEAVTSGINMAVFGDHSRPSGRPHTQNRTVYRPETDYTSQNTRTSRYTSARPEPSKRGPEMIRSVKYGVDEYPIESRMDANNVLTMLHEYADRYDYVSVADYYDLLGVKSVYTDHNFGWSFEEILKAVVTPLRGGGYIINLPPVTEI